MANLKLEGGGAEGKLASKENEEKEVALYFNDKEVAEKEDVDNSISNLTSKITTNTTSIGTLASKIEDLQNQINNLNIPSTSNLVPYPNFNRYDFYSSNSRTYSITVSHDGWLLVDMKSSCGANIKINGNTFHVRSNDTDLSGSSIMFPVRSGDIVEGINDRSDYGYVGFYLFYFRE